MTNKCLMCGNTVRVYAKDYRFDDGSIIDRVGKFDRGIAINEIDPHGYFCTLRCAARYGVYAASKGRAK